MVGVEQVQDAVVEAGGDPAAGKVVADRVLPAGQGEQAAGVDGPFDLDRRARRDRSGGQRWWPGQASVVGQQLLQLGQEGRAADTGPTGNPMLFPARWRELVYKFDGKSIGRRCSTAASSKVNGALLRPLATL